jgi:hypothetical protein
VDDFDDSVLERLILDGMVEFAGLDRKTGEMLYSFTDKAITSLPDFFVTAMESQMKDIYTLWELGFLDMNISEENPLVKITKMALDPEFVDALPTELRLALEQIIEMTRIDED